ncbi:MAG: STAS domain-containing protein [Clostridia bacterium]|nr:STAS domain-containing protein [Clostridia bacterium]
MIITESRIDKALRITLEGSLNAVTTPQLEALLRTSLDGITEIVFDLDKLVYISSAGLRVLYAAKNLMNKVGGNLLIYHVRPDIREVFDVTGLSKVLTLL